MLQKRDELMAQSTRLTSLNEPARGRAGLSNHVDRSDLSAGAVVRAREPSTDVELWALNMP